MFELADILFIIASSIFILLAYIVRQKTLYIICQTICNVILIVNYLYLGSLSSLLAVIVATVRFIAFYLLVRKFNDVKWWIIALFCIATVAVSVFSVSQPLDYFFIASVVIYTICYKVKNLMYMKIALLIPLTMMLTYNIFMLAYSGIIAQGFEIALILVQTANYIIKTKKSKNKVNYER